jgi:hypothetical protein
MKDNDCFTREYPGSSRRTVAGAADPAQEPLVIHSRVLPKFQTIKLQAESLSVRSSEQIAKRRNPRAEQPRCGARARGSKPKAVRRRGSRRVTTTSTASGGDPPEPPKPAGDALAGVFTGCRGGER